MNAKLLKSHKLRNMLHTLAFVAAMSALVAISASLLFGEGVWLWALTGSALAFVFMPDVSPRWVLNRYQAKQIQPYQFPQLYQTIKRLSKRAGLTEIPAVYWVPSQSLNAFAVGNKADAAVAITDGLLQKLTHEEIAGVLAHEISHIANNDLWLMNLADLLSRITNILSLVGLFLVVLFIPMVAMGIASISLLGLLVLILAPVISTLLQFALSRVREFDADLEAVRLTGDPYGLASALQKIEKQEASFWQKLMMPSPNQAEPSIFRSHPDTRERISHLLSLQPDYHNQTGQLPSSYAWGRPVFSNPRAHLYFHPRQRLHKHS